MDPERNGAPKMLTLNALTDIAGNLAGCTDAQAWQTVTDICETVGISAVNVVELDMTTKTTLRFRSSMSSRWLSDYVEQDFAGVDPMIPTALGGPGIRAVKARQMIRSEAPCTKAYELNHQLGDAGYATIVGDSFAASGSDRLRLVTTAFSDDAAVPAHISLLLALFACRLPLATPTDSDIIVLPAARSRLTAREHDVLRLLALGLRNDAIAHRLGLAEVTVRAHVTSARRRLGASTREQAIAIAIMEGELDL